MRPCRSRHDGFLIAPRTWSLLCAAKTVTVVTNSRRVPADFFSHLERSVRVVPSRHDDPSGPAGVERRVPSSRKCLDANDSDVFVVFNRHRFLFDERLAASTLWVHRIDEASGRYFGDDAGDDPVSRRFHRLYVAGDPPGKVGPRSCASYLSYRASLPSLLDYPVGRRLLVPQRGVRTIVSPSTGFAVFALLEELQRRGAGFRLRAIGIGREYGGWPGHDWAHERSRLRRSTIDFRTPDGRPDHWHRFLDTVPYDLVRVFGKLASA